MTFSAGGDPGTQSVLASTRDRSIMLTQPAADFPFGRSSSDFSSSLRPSTGFLREQFIVILLMFAGGAGFVGSGQLPILDRRTELRQGVADVAR